ncbi:MAG: hypothetical protein KTR31_05060 [Myxococcales bacterium]|nr:hypothetical protein [Myxococcales bacterium]
MQASAVIDTKRERRRQRDMALTPADRFRLGALLRRRAVSMFASAHGLTYGAALHRLGGRPGAAGAGSMTTTPRLLAMVHQRLVEEGIQYAIVGATAMQLHGYVRATMDVDLFTDSERVLDQAMWADMPDGVDVRVIDNRLEDSDPLTGSVQFEAEDTDELVDLIVSRPGSGPRGIVSHARPMALFEGLEMPVASPLHLVMMKLFAGSRRDLADVEELCVAVPDLAEQVDASMSTMDEEERRRWMEIRSGP